MKRVILVKLRLGLKDREDSLCELRELTRSIDGVVIDEVTQTRMSPCPNTYIGEGKVEELKEKVINKRIDLIIFDNELTGTQIRNLESIIGIRVIDRTQLILDIFARRARTREARLQVELAQLMYLLSRLGGKGLFLSRLGGGIGTRGPGEMKLEYDRRRIRKRIDHLKGMMDDVVKERREQRAGRKGFVVFAIVGYTNAGKSTLLNTLTLSCVKVEDRLFSTLDPTIRGLVLPNNQKVLLVDTVGFIRNLPHHLISSFHATLEEVREADCLLHVVDASSPWMEEEIDEVNKVLLQLGAISKPSLILLNKIDRFNESSLNSIDKMLRRIPNSVAISALKCQGIDELLKAMTNMPPLRLEYLSMSIPLDKVRLYARICKEGDVLSTKFKEDRIIMDVGLPSKKIAIFKRLLLK